MAWFGKTKATTDASEKKTLGKGVFRKCVACGVTLKAEDFTANNEVCPECGHHYRLSGEAWVELLLDPGSFEERDTGLFSGDPLEFFDSKPYPQRLDASRKKTGLEDAMMVGEGTMGGRPLQFGAFLFRFMGGSMGSVVGEKITRAVELATEEERALIIISSSSGARMQEGMLSLMQMAKTCGAIARHNNAGLPYLSVFTHPTTGGVTASFASIGDINLAEPRCMIGFAGPRVVKETTHQDLPPGFQTAEFMLEHGLIDSIVERRFLRERLVQLLGYMMPV